MDIVAIVLQALLGLAFLGAGFSKIAGVQMHVDNFKNWGLPQWFRVVTGLVEVAGAVALILGFWEPSWAAVAGLWLGFTMFVGILVHVRMKDSLKMTFPAIVLCVLPLVVFFILSGDLSDFPGF